ALRQLALGDAVGPVAEIFERDAAELSGNPVGHLLAGLPGLDAAHPRFCAGLELAEGGRDRPGRLLAQLMAADAVDVVYLPEPVLASDVLRDITRAAELARRRNFQHREPIGCRIILRCRRLIRRRHRAQIELLARLAVDLG